MFQTDVKNTVENNCSPSLLNCSSEILRGFFETPVFELCEQNQLELVIRREDQIHPIISGNKWHKLRHNLMHAKQQGIQTLVSFGGAWSNYLHALAYACKLEGLSCIAYVRGDELESKPYNFMLSDMSKWGAQLIFISRSEYLKRNDEQFLKHLAQKHQGALIIPEGAANQAGFLGCVEFAREVLDDYNHEFESLPDEIILAAGTGLMFSGFVKVISELKLENIKVKAYAAVKDSHNIEKRLKLFLGERNYLASIDKFELIDSYVGKGFGLANKQQLDFSEQFRLQSGILLDPVYTSRMMYGFFEDIQREQLVKGSRVLVIHSGGLQGWRSLSPA